MANEIINLEMDRKSSTGELWSYLTGLIKKNYAYAFRQLLLRPDQNLELTVRIRHYDNQCQAAEHIADVIKIPLERKKMEAFLNMKTYRSRKFSRCNSSSRVSSNCSKKKLERKNSYQNKMLGNSRGTSIYKCSPWGKQYQLKQIFQRVKLIAKDLVEEKKDKFIGHKVEQKSGKSTKPQIMVKIAMLQREMNQLVEVQKINSTPISTAPSFRKIHAEKLKNIRIQKYDCYI